MREFCQTDLQAIARDALSSEGKTPQQRMAMFADLLETVAAIWDHLTPDERRRRMRIADQLNRRPEPWWINFRPEALREYLNRKEMCCEPANHAIGREYDDSCHKKKGG
jgi:hypothetical protein